MNAPGTGPSQQRLGRYHLSDCLGGGPTGEVFRAKVYGVAGMDREFAVKRFHTSLVASPQAAAALAVAARMYGALEHPHVARLHEFGEAGGQTFTATEFVDGLDLAQLIDQGQLALGAAAALIVQIGRAVGYAHGRGLSHLGLAPTNVICSDRGDIKVTDFGVLPSRLPRQPALDESLRPRLCYLAPEQLEGQATSPATDVYQLGIIAFELMVGRKPFPGRNNSEIAQQILSMPVPASGLPKPYEKLLRRALARSPFERFPDAGAMADALEAALRASPAPGTVADAGAAVATGRQALQQRRGLQASGALSFPIPAPPSAPKEEVLERVATPPPIPQAARMAHTAMSPVPSIPPRRAPSHEDTVPDLGNDAETRVGDFKDDFTTLGAGVTEQAPTVVRPDLLEEDTILGDDLELGPAGTDPSVAPQDLLGGVDMAYTLPDEAPTRIQKEPRAATADEETEVRGNDTARQEGFAIPEDALSTRPTRRNMESTLGEFDPDDLEETAVPASARPAPRPAAAQAPKAAPAVAHAGAAPRPAVAQVPKRSVPVAPLSASLPEPYHPGQSEHSELIRVPPGAPEPVPIPPLPSMESGFGSRGYRMPPELLPPSPAASRPRSKKAFALPVVLTCAALSAAAFFGYQYLAGESQAGPTTAKVVPLDAALVIPALAPPDKSTDASAAEAVATVTDAGAVAALTGDAASAVPTTVGPDAAGATPAAVIATELPGRLRIESAPAGAKVYLDGTMVGTTPVDLDASSDQHRVALLLPGYDLYTGDVNGTGQVKIALSEVTPPEGPAGIKVRCKKKNRYYVYVDGDPVGELCPSERIGVAKGQHVVEIYDPLTDSRRAFPVDVVDTRLSVRVKVD